MDEDIELLLKERADSMRAFSLDYKPINMYAIFRRDLEMDIGKLAAQSGHAFEMTHSLALNMRPEITSQYKGSGNGTKICMYAKNLPHLIKAYRWLQERSLPCYLIIDRGHVLPPHFDGKPIITALGIGPVYRTEVEDIIKKYTMIKAP